MSVTPQPLRILICGLGFMGKTHASLWASLPQTRIVGIVEQRPPEALSGILSDLGLPVDLPILPSIEDACAQLQPDAIDLCTPTHLHRQQAAEAFAHGCHVFCEKPIALSLDDAAAMVDAAAAAQRQLMVGHCIRFWPEYETLAQTLADGSLGELLFLDMQRTAGRPAYAIDRWTDDPSRCLGAALDMHIHDADWIHATFGLPQSVSSSGLKLGSGWDYVATQYRYARQAVITARGGWCLPPDSTFRMAYQAVFERGVLEYDSSQQPGVQLTSPDAKRLIPSPAADDPIVAYRRQLAYFADHLRQGKPIEQATGRQAYQSLRLVLAEIQSAETQTPQKLS